MQCRNLLLRHNITSFLWQRKQLSQKCCCFIAELWWSRKIKKNQHSSALKSKEKDVQRDISSPECSKSRAWEIKNLEKHVTYSSLCTSTKDTDVTSLPLQKFVRSCVYTGRTATYSALFMQKPLRQLWSCVKHWCCRGIMSCCEREASFKQQNKQWKEGLQQKLPEHQHTSC